MLYLITDYSDDLFDPKKIEKESMWDFETVTCFYPDTNQTFPVSLHKTEIRKRVAEQTLIEKYGIDKEEWDAFISFYEDAVRNEANHDDYSQSEDQ